MTQRMRTFWRINHDGQVQAVESKRLSKLFSSFDLSSVQISFVGLIGDFAVWAVTDLTTGDIEYIIDDSGGSIEKMSVVHRNTGSVLTSTDFTCKKSFLRPSQQSVPYLGSNRLARFLVWTTRVHPFRANGVFWVNGIQIRISYLYFV